MTVPARRSSAARGILRLAGAALVADFRKLLVSAAAGGDPCTCLKWKEAYADGKILCGEFAEMRTVTRPRVNLTLMEVLGAFQHPYHMEKCQQWLQLLDDNPCLNLDGHALSGWIPGSTAFDSAAWCYVSKECKELNGGQEIEDKIAPDGQVHERKLSAKLCKPGSDRLLRDFGIEELRAMVSKLRTARPGETSMLTLGLVSLEAYRALHPLMGMWEALAPRFKSLTSEDMKRLPAPLVSAMKAGDPMIIYVGDPGNHDNYKVVVGTRVLSLDVERKKWFFGLLKTSDHVCPDTVHCLTETRRDEL